jgi:type I restriction enzyme S subunit
MLDKEKNTGVPRRYLRNPNIRWFEFDLSDLKEILVEERDVHKYEIIDGDVLICEGGEAGRAAVWNGSSNGIIFQKACHRVRAGPRLDAKYLVHRLFYDYQSGGLDDYYTGATIKHLTGQDLARYEFPLPPLPEQRRIAAILDKADALRRKRKRAIALFDSLTQSIFRKMFGNPAANPNGYQLMTFGEIAERMSDGPFGSNLKSEHYADDGVRVIRLQNIGVGEFLDHDKAFISNDHFSRLSKHECRAGDVLIGTLGEPNLRACVQPVWLPIAINKADCVQLRPDPAIVRAEYLCALINDPATEGLAQSLMLGQTRTRISMGRLRDLQIPIAPLEQQARFCKVVRSVNADQALAKKHRTQTNALFLSLQHRAFSGQL